MIKKLIEKGKYAEALYVMDKKNFENIFIDENNSRKLYNYISISNNFVFLKSTFISLLNIKTIYHIQNKVKINDDIDIFSPFSENCLKLNLDKNKIKFIENTDQLDEMDIIKQSEIISVDTEWKPYSNKFYKTKASIMQMACSDSIFIIDLLKLENDHLFLEKLQNVIDKKKIIGFNFSSDLNMLNPQIKNIFTNKTQIISIDKIIDQKYKDLKLYSLSKTVKHFFNLDLCKRLQISNWERRPLTQRKLHYLALDAFVLLNIYNIIA